jgi:2'-5' RNA ligase
MRIFYAVQFANAVKQAMADNLLEIKRHTLRGGFTPRDNFHLTLLFIGECEPAHLADYKKAADSAAAKLAPFIARIDGLGTFARHDGDILWAGVEPANMLGMINKSLLAELQALNISIKQEHDKFVPHVTFGRKVQFADKNLSVIDFKPADFEICSIAVMESILDRGVIYRTVYESRFK